MTVTPTIEQLRKDIDSARTDLARLEGQQQSAVAELSKLEAEATELGLDPTNLMGESTRIRDDVNTVVSVVREEIDAMKGEAPADD